MSNFATKLNILVLSSLRTFRVNHPELRLLEAVQAMRC